MPPCAVYRKLPQSGKGGGKEEGAKCTVLQKLSAEPSQQPNFFFPVV